MLIKGDRINKAVESYLRGKNLPLLVSDSENYLELIFT